VLVTFHSKAWSSITMFGDVAATLLKMAGHSGIVPGALLAGDIPAALTRLEQQLAATGPEKGPKQSIPPEAGEESIPPPVGLSVRAYSLTQMLSAAASQGCDVMWEVNHQAL
jgi:hypothetical protein